MSNHESYWQREASWCDRPRDAPVPKRADFAVIGGGFAGLTTAIRLREQNPGAAIVVLEAERVGYGASGRNAGFLSPLAAPIWLLGAERSTEQAWAAFQINAHIHTLARWLGDVMPECEVQRVKLGLASASRWADGALGEFSRAVEIVGLEHQLSQSRARPRHLVLEMDAYTLHPYKVARGLAEYAAQIGVRIHERVPVRGLEPASGGARVRLDDGELHAGKVVVCTNAYTSSLDAGERVRALVVHSFMTSTAPLDAAHAITRDGDFTVEVNTTQAYHRMHGSRIIYGGIDKLVAPAGGDFAVPSGVKARLSRAMRASFPHVSDLAIAEAWSGKFHATPTGLPIIRTSKANPAVVFNVGYGGTGVALSLACGSLAAGVAAERFAHPDDDRLLSVIRETRISMRDTVRTVARLARRLAFPWSSS